MRYYPKLKIFKSSNGRNRFDGREARSYDWYVYAVKMTDGTVAEVRKSYSNTTSGHISKFWSIVGYKTPSIYITAPQGLGNLDRARNEIAYEIKRLETELANPRNRARQRRLDAIANYRTELRNIDRLEADNAAYRASKGGAL